MSNKKEPPIILQWDETQNISSHEEIKEELQSDVAEEHPSGGVTGLENQNDIIYEEVRKQPKAVLQKSIVIWLVKIIIVMILVRKWIRNI
jgi:hypothetical protein